MKEHKVQISQSQTILLVSGVHMWVEHSTEFFADMCQQEMLTSNKHSLPGLYSVISSNQTAKQQKSLYHLK